MGPAMAQRPFDKEGLNERVGPFVAVSVIALAGLIVRGASGTATLVSATGIALLIVAIFGVPWAKLPPWTDLIVPLAYFGVVAAMRDAEGGHGATTGIFVLLPVVWFALHSRLSYLVLSMIGAIAVFVVPVVLVGPPQYPTTELTKALNLTLVVAMVGVVVFQLVDDRNRLMQELEDQALHDSLTALPNRRAWDGAVAEAVQTAQRTGRPLTVALLDLDDLKQINDHGGHAAGDRALQHASAAWSGVLPAGALLARVGGDEFGVLIADMGGAAAEEVIACIRLAGKPYSASAGIATLTPGDDADALMRAADTALYVAKSGGRHRVHAA
jgi:diguanylate cyclase (GGDEF)-like protein